MANRPDYEVIAKLPPKKGEEKAQWRKVGACWSSERGISGRIESIPIGWDGSFILAEPKPVEQKVDRGIPQDMKDDIPY
jgi:hypothetical protein